MIEQEAWGLLTKSQFNQYLAQFTKKFGKSKHQKRLSFSFWDHRYNEIDTRIRITNGKAEIVQKIGQWENVTQWERMERIVKLPRDAQQIFNAFKIFRQLLPASESCNIMQYDNYLFLQTNFEIKLTHQYGKTSKYNIELETLDNKIDMVSILEELGLSKLVTVTDVEFWDNWNKELNLNDRDLTEEHILELIQKYI